MEAADLQGYWRSVGYNRAFSFNGDHYSLYTVTSGCACKYDGGSFEDFNIAYDRICLHSPDHLSLYYAGDLTRYEYTRTRELPADSSAGEASGPVPTFEDFCRVFAENYAFFDLQGVDWSLARQTHGAQITPHTSDGELQDILRQMITPLRDGHVSVSAGDARLQSFPNNRGPREALQALFSLPAPFISPRISMNRLAERLESVLLVPLFPDCTRLSRAGNDIISWGVLEGNIGYVSVLRLFGFADTPQHKSADDLPHRPVDCAPFLAADMRALEAHFDRVMSDLADTDALIIDARINGGGFDRAGLELARRFTDRKRTAYSKRARHGSGYTRQQTISLEPHSTPPYLKPVAMLISEFTLSAGEVFALCMQSIPHVHLVGSASAGILSDNLFHLLPNGWEVSLSNEIYRSSAGRCYESIGVKPDIPLPPLGPDLAGDFRSGLAAAVDFLTQQLR